MKAMKREEDVSASLDVLVPLEFVHAGETAEIIEVHGESALVNRLAEMGLRAGCQVRVLQPGSPCLLQVGGARLSLRPDWALQILVRPLAACAA